MRQWVSASGEAERRNCECRAALIAFPRGTTSKPQRLNPSDNMENYHEEVTLLGVQLQSLCIPCTR